MLINQTIARIQRSLTAFVLTLFIACASTGPRDVASREGWARVQPYPSLAARINHFLNDSLFPPSNAGIMVYSLTRREILYALNPDLLFAPASNQKIVTAAAALELLSPNFCFPTEIFVDTAGTRRLIVRGSGDPLLDDDDLDSIASAIAQRIDTSRTWELSGDPSFFDDIRKGKGWMWDDDPYVAPIGALSVNGNSIAIRVLPGSRSGSPTTASLMDSSAGLVALHNRSTTGSSGRADSLVFHRTTGEGTEHITVDGTIGPERKESRTEIGVTDPAGYFLQLLVGKLSSYGVKVGKKSIGLVSDEDTASFSHCRAIDSVLCVMLKESDNLSAENVFRTLGRTVTGEPGSTEGGILAAKTALHRFGIDTAKVEIADGSGVSRYNLLTASVLVRTLEAMYERSDFLLRFHRALPVAGVDGTLSTRMKGTPAQGNLRAKTGTLRGASSLSGYVTTGDGEVLAFSILMQNYPSAPKDYRNAQDSIGVYLSSVRRSAF